MFRHKPNLHSHALFVKPFMHQRRLEPSIVATSDKQFLVHKNIKDIFDRVKYRHEKSKSILGSGVMSEDEYAEVDLDDEELDVEKLTQENSPLKSIGGLGVESRLHHTWILEQNRSQAEKLPDYILSAKNYSEPTPYMFVLIEFEGKYIPILYDLKHEYIERDEVLKILDLISCTASSPRANVKFSEVEHFTNETVQAWCKVKNVPVASVRKICGLYLQPYEQAKGIKNFLKGS
ncbi:MAG: hypothetical protein HOP27_14920 [Anaerolineales bacterium]|nr:hypothetical protein [Anaerolineales bacterium]